MRIYVQNLIWCEKFINYKWFNENIQSICVIGKGDHVIVCANDESSVLFQRVNLDVGCESNETFRFKVSKEFFKTLKSQCKRKKPEPCRIERTENGLALICKNINIPLQEVTERMPNVFTFIEEYKNKKKVNYNSGYLSDFDKFIPFDAERKTCTEIVQRETMIGFYYDNIDGINDIPYYCDAAFGITMSKEFSNIVRLDKKMKDVENSLNSIC